MSPTNMMSCWCIILAISQLLNVFLFQSHLRILLSHIPFCKWERVGHGRSVWFLQNKEKKVNLKQCKRNILGAKLQLSRVHVRVNHMMCHHLDYYSHCVMYRFWQLSKRYLHTFLIRDNYDIVSCICKTYWLEAH